MVMGWRGMVISLQHLPPFPMYVFWLLVVVDIWPGSERKGATLSMRGEMWKTWISLPLLYLPLLGKKGGVV